MEKYSEMDFQDKLESLEELLGEERMYRAFLSMMGERQIDSFLDQIIVDYDLEDYDDEDDEDWDNEDEENEDGDGN